MEHLMCLNFNGTLPTAAIEQLSESKVRVSVNIALHQPTYAPQHTYLSSLVLVGFGAGLPRLSLLHAESVRSVGESSFTERRCQTCAIMSDDRAQARDEENGNEEDPGHRGL